MLNTHALLHEMMERIPAYSKFIAESAQQEAFNPSDFEQLPLLTKQNYLLNYPMRELCRAEDLNSFHLIGASSGFSKTGAVYWPKRPQDEAGYMQAIETQLRDNYGTDKRRTLVIVSLAFGMWIGGMQIAAAVRNIALSGKYPLMLATPGLDLKAAVNVIKSYQDLFDQLLIITNPSNISLFTALLNQADVHLAPGTVSFPVVGEYFSEAFREHISSTYGHATDSPFVLWTGYGSADTGDVSAETKETIALRKYLHHHPQLAEKLFETCTVPMILAVSPQVYLEIIDGNIIVTKDQFIPLIRYNTGDEGGLLTKESLRGEVPDELLNNLPEQMMFVHGRAKSAIIFYGTNLMVNAISDHLLSLPSNYGYGGLFTVKEVEVEGIATFHFTIYTAVHPDMDAAGYRQSLIDFFCTQSAEFNFKYQNLSKSVSVPLISVSLADITSLDSQVKHRYIL
ncbi:MAG: hypothetical protein RR249_05375 [Tannerellaceae bacterium]